MSETYDEANERMVRTLGPRAEGSIRGMGSWSPDAPDTQDVPADDEDPVAAVQGVRCGGITFRSEPPDAIQFIVDEPSRTVTLRVQQEDEPPAVAGAAGAASDICALRATKDRPEGYTEAEGATKGWVTWGHVNSVVVSNVAESYSLSTGKKVYMKVTTNGAIPLRVLTAEIDATTSTREDSGGTATTPPTTAYYLLGQVAGAGTVESPYTVFPSGCGNLRLSAVPMGYSCTLATAGDPEADPPVSASPGGVKTDYQLRWDRVA
jgi:hypothetical protein